MAMNRADYVAKGRADFLAGKPRAGSAKPVYSWQENAYDEGYNGAFREAAVKQAETAPASTGTVEVTAVKTENVANAVGNVGLYDLKGSVKFKTLNRGQRFTQVGSNVSLLKCSDTEAVETDTAGKAVKLVRLGRNDRVFPKAGLVAHPTPVSRAAVAHVRLAAAMGSKWSDKRADPVRTLAQAAKGAA